jgi:CubicO group peptidase (beta-lactamase class C family)
MPDNFKPADASNPYIDYNATKLYEFVGRHGVERSADAAFLYSNLGLGLLGHALSLRAGIPYEQLLEDEVTGPLALKDTVVTLTPDQQSRFIEGHGPDNRPAHSWEEDVLAGAGAIRSTAGDMLTYLEAQLHPDKLASSQKDSGSGRTLPAAIALSQELRTDAGPQMRIAFAWFYNEKSGSYWHNGATGGYSSFVFFNPKGDYAAVVLMNRTIGPRGSFADLLGTYLSQRFTGQPAVSLAAR